MAKKEINIPTTNLKRKRSAKEIPSSSDDFQQQQKRPKISSIYDDKSNFDGAPATNISLMRLKLRSASKIINTSLSNDFKKKSPIMNASKSISSTSKISKKTKLDETFDFPALPYVCQRRFAEICDFQTLNALASINSQTKRLAKRLHVIGEAKVIFEHKTTSIKYKLKCFCIGDERCKQIHENYQPLPLIKGNQQQQIEVMDEISIWKPRKIISHQMIDKLPLNFGLVKRLKFDYCKIELNYLKEIIRDKPELKEVVFHGSIWARNCCSSQGFIEFIKSLTKFDSFSFNIHRDGSSFSFKLCELREPCLLLVKEKIIDSFKINNNFVYFNKSKL